MLDVQQARATLEDVSTNVRVAVLSRFTNFAISDGNTPPVTPGPPSEPSFQSGSADNTPRGGYANAGRHSYQALHVVQALHSVQVYALT